MDPYEALAEAWLINHRATLLLLERLSPEALRTTLSTRGGRTVGQQFAHVLEVRRTRIEAADRERARTLPVVTRENGHDGDFLREACERTGEAIADLIRESAKGDGRVKGFKRGIAALVTYLVAHDAHHRGHALLTLKQAKVKRPPELRFGLWDWNRL